MKNGGASQQNLGRPRAICRHYKVTKHRSGTVTEPTPRPHPADVVLRGKETKKRKINFLEGKIRIGRLVLIKCM